MRRQCAEGQRDWLFPETRRLTEGEAFLTLLFDLAQLSFLILLTGGLTNPFALLVLREACPCPNG